MPDTTSKYGLSRGLRCDECGKIEHVSHVFTGANGDKSLATKIQLFETLIGSLHKIRKCKCVHCTTLDDFVLPDDFYRISDDMQTIKDLTDALKWIAENYPEIGLTIEEIKLNNTNAPMLQLPPEMVNFHVKVPELLERIAKALEAKICECGGDCDCQDEG